MTGHSNPDATRVVRVITRLNIGGPSIQATRLTALDRDGFSTTLIHGRLGAGEGDMRYLIEPGSRAIYVDTLCRPLSPVNDLRACLRILGELRAVRPHIVHTHMAKAGLLGRVAAALYNATRGRSPRARVVHTYHGHVLEGYFSPLMTSDVHRPRAAAGGRQRRDRRDLAGDRARTARHLCASAAPVNTASSRSASTWRRLPRSTTRHARPARQRSAAAARMPTWSATVGRLTAIKQHRLVPRHGGERGGGAAAAAGADRG